MFVFKHRIADIILSIFALVANAQNSTDIVTLKFVSDSLQQFFEEPKDILTFKSAYDFIIVGAGTSGCALANRLTENPKWDVLLVEAGGHEFFYMDVPMLAHSLQSTPANWDYKTEPSHKYCTGFKNNQCRFPRGKVVGGSSVLNYMIYTRGSPQDYDNWGAMGNKGWGWNDVLPYFKKVENYSINEFFDSKYHSRNGLLNIDYSPYQTDKSKAWIKAAEEYGFKHGDYNGAMPSSVVSRVQLSMKNGTRHSAGRAYLHPIRDRKNFSLSKHSLVTKLIFNLAKTAVKGVELTKRGLRYRVYARKEVIISAGAINSPQLLMLSGIGPKDHLNDMKIPVVKDLPVGYNLMDHVATGGLIFTVEREPNMESLFYALTHYNSVVRYYMDTHRGPFSLPGGTEALIFTELKDKFNFTAWTDVELLLIASGLNSDPLLKYNFNYRADLYDQIYGPLGDKNSFMIFPMLMRPKSKGRIKLRNRNPKAPPRIIPNYFEAEDDLDKIVEAVKIAIEISKQPALQALGAKLYDVPIRRCLNYGSFGSDEYFKCMTRMFPFTIYHQSGTCKMGQIGDPTTVVDSELRIHGISNVRVADASIFPYITSGHTNAAVYMIAEKTADIIKEHWNKKKTT